MFTFESVVRFSETDAQEKLPLPGIINYFQDCSEFHSESLGSGAGTLGNYAWILSSWQIQLKRYPKRSETITIATKPHSFKGIEGQRNFLIQDSTGDVIVNANSIWSYFDMEKQRPARITQDQYDCYKLEEAYPMDYAPRKIDLKDIAEDSWECLHRITVHPSMLDMFGHMNNSQYATIGCDALPEQYEFHQVRIEYKKSALLEDEVVVRRAILEDRLVIRLDDKKNSTYAVLEFC